MANKIRRDDEVIVLTGKDKGKTGKVLKVLVAEGRVYVSGVNFVKKHQKPIPALNTQVASLRRSLNSRFKCSDLQSKNWKG